MQALSGQSQTETLLSVGQRINASSRLVGQRERERQRAREKTGYFILNVVPRVDPVKKSTTRPDSVFISTSMVLTEYYLGWL